MKGVVIIACMLLVSFAVRSKAIPAGSREKQRNQVLELLARYLDEDLRKEQQESLDQINQAYKASGDYDDVEQLDDKLVSYKARFREFDSDNSGDIDLMELKMGLENMEMAKTHLELKKMIAEVDTNNSGTIDYKNFLDMMLGKKMSIFKVILMFNDGERKGPACSSPICKLP